MKKIVTFGEVMARFTPPGFMRIDQVMPGSLDVSFAGAESNVAAGIALLGGSACFVSALPQNPLGTACLRSFRALGVNVDHIVRDKGGRLGLFFTETGANQRASQVIYDRERSSFSCTPASAYDWPAILAGAGWFHTTGIAAAVSKVAAEATVSAVRLARAVPGMTLSCDLNFRRKLWSWDAALDPEALARKTMEQILPSVDLVIGNEEDAANVLGIHAGASDVKAGRLDAGGYSEAAESIARRFPNVKLVAITLRRSLSANHNDWGGMLYHVAERRSFFAPLKGGQYEPYEIRNIVDRVGSGDAFAAALIFALSSTKLKDPATAINFATAASCLAHSIKGDINFASHEEIESLMKGDGSGRIKR